MAKPQLSTRAWALMVSAEDRGAILLSHPRPQMNTWTWTWCCPGQEGIWIVGTCQALIVFRILIMITLPIFI